MSFVEDHPLLSGFIGGYAAKASSSEMSVESGPYYYLQDKYEAFELALDSIKELGCDISLNEEDKLKYDLLQETIAEMMEETKNEMDVFSLSPQVSPRAL